MSKQKVGILLVEDEDAHAEIVRRSFESGWDRFHLTVASGLQEAKDYVAKLTPSVLNRTQQKFTQTVPVTKLASRSAAY